MSAPPWPRQIVIAGSGKMARDVGLFFLGRGHAVAWLSRDQDRLATLERWISRRVRRLADLLDSWSPGQAAFFLVGDPAIPAADVFIESINEAEEDKQALLRALDGAIPAEALRLSNSSSILPAVIHPGCAGLHFFYPVEMTGFVEAVFPEGFADDDRRRVLDLLDQSDLECIEQADARAFATNRLLLPVQNECFRALMAGAPAEEVDRASTSPVLPLGQLTLMDTIGLDVIAPAVHNFTARMEPEVAAHYRFLRDGLDQLVAAGKQGHKNRDGLRLGRELPWGGAPSEGSAPRLDRLLHALFVNTCHHALERGLLAPRELDLALCSLFGWDRSLAEAWAPLEPAEALEALDRAFRRWGAPYLIPARALRDLDTEGRRWPETGAVI